MKSSFVLHTHQQDAFNNLTDAQAGALIKGIFAYQATGNLPVFEESALKIAFAFIKHSLDSSAQKYEQVCAKRAANGRKGGLAKAGKRSICLPSENLAAAGNTKHTDTKTDTDTKTKTDTKTDINIFTARGTPAQDTYHSSLPKQALHTFAGEVLKRFEPPLDTAQQDVWFKRNCRCLKDILLFCHGDIPLALSTIDVCLEGLEKAGYSGGYEAVLRNITNYYAQAEKRLQRGAYGH